MSWRDYGRKETKPVILGLDGWNDWMAKMGGTTDLLEPIVEARPLGSTYAPFINQKAKDSAINPTTGGDEPWYKSEGMASNIGAIGNLALGAASYFQQRDMNKLVKRDMNLRYKAAKADSEFLAHNRRALGYKG